MNQETNVQEARVRQPWTAQRVGDILLNNALLIIMAIAVVYIAIKNPNFIKPASLINILSQTAAYLPAALGIGGCIVLTGTDLSAGRIVGLTACVSASLLQAVTASSKMWPNVTPPPVLLVLALAMVIGAAFGAFNGFFVAKFKLHPFIVTLATQLIVLYLAFFIFAFVVYGLAVKIIGKESPFKFLKTIMPAALNAFGTCSSSATIPISKQCMEEGMGVSNKITSIAIPLGATVNMDAVSILMSFMIMFFANACGINVSVSMMVIILLANVLLSVGTPGVPGGAIASFAALATMAGLPAGVMGVYISINTLCDMGATCVNVIGDLACCVALKGRLKIDEK